MLPAVLDFSSERCSRPGADIRLSLCCGVGRLANCAVTFTPGGLVFLRNVRSSRGASCRPGRCRAREAARSISEPVRHLARPDPGTDGQAAIRQPAAGRSRRGRGDGRPQRHASSIRRSQMTRAGAAPPGASCASSTAATSTRSPGGALHWTGVWSALTRSTSSGRDLTERLAAEERVRRSCNSGDQTLTGGIARLQQSAQPGDQQHRAPLLDRADLPQDAISTPPRRVRRGAELVRGLLAFARQQPLAPQAIDANALLANTARLLGRMLGGNIVVEFSGATDLWPLHRRAPARIGDLAVNARDAMPGGRLTLSTRNMTLQEATCATHPVAGRLHRDHGDRHRHWHSAGSISHFDPFFTTKGGQGHRPGSAWCSASSSSRAGISGRQRGRQAPACGSPAAHQRAVRQRGHRHRARPETPCAFALRQIVVAQLRKLGCHEEADRASTALGLLDTGERFDLLFTDLACPAASAATPWRARPVAARPQGALHLGAGRGAGRWRFGG